MIDVFTDEYFMKQALQQARIAYDAGEVPVGAVIVTHQQIIAKAHNQVEQLGDVTAHAEILAITAASDFLGSKYLQDCTLYVTLEPCLMCAGALFWSQIGKVVIGARDAKRGFSTLEKPLLHPKTELNFDVMAHESEILLKAFFKALR